MIKIRLLGTNGWFDTDQGKTISILIQFPEADLVLDAGNGISQIKRYIAPQRPLYIFLSHYHLDHTSGLHTLARLGPRDPVTFLGRKGIENDLGGLLRRPYTLSPDDLPFDVLYQELKEQDNDLPFSIQTHELVHSDPVLGLRLETESGVLAYIPDTGYCQAAVDLAVQADIVFAECAHLPGEKNHSWPHLDPESGARIAKEAGANRLILVHFDASRYTSMDLRKKAERIARSVFPDTIAGQDGMTFELPLIP